jgi:hypothetical protein
MRKDFFSAFLLAGLLGLVGIAQAALVVQPVSVSIEGATSAVRADAMINNSGFSASDMYVAGEDFDAYIAKGTNHSSATNPNFFEGQGLPFNMDFDLGGTFKIESLALWNANGTGALKDFQIFAADNASFTGALDLGTFQATQSLNPAQIFAFSATDASFIRLRGLSNQTTDDRLFIGEIIFDGSPASVPVPATAALMFIGLAVAGYVGRRKQR